KWLDPSQTAYYDAADVYIRVNAPSNTRANTNINAQRNQLFQKAHSPWLDTRMQRSAAGQMRWVGALFPTEALAQEAGMSLEEYEDFVYAATFADREDAVAAWQQMGDMQQQKIDWLKGRKQVHVQGPNAEIGRAHV